MRIQDINTLPPASVEKEMANAIANRRNYFEFRHRRADGSVRDVSVFSSDINIRGRAILHSIIQDITERKQAEEALRIERNQLLSIFDSIDEAIYVADTETYEILYVNKYLKNAFGKDSVGGICYREFQGLDSPCGFCTNEIILRHKYASHEWEHYNPVLQRHYLILDRIIRWPDGRDVRFELATDITERKRAEEEREKLQAQLAQTQKMESVGRLAGGVAHDFNNMLSVILGHTEMALDEIDPTQNAHADLQGVLGAAHRSADLVRQLLAFARKQTIIPKVLDLNETVEGMLNLLRRLIGEDIDLARLPGRELWPVKIDPSQIDQVLANLCVNARDAITGVGKVTIETGNAVFDEAYCREHAGFVPGEYVLLAVSDDGCGMDQKVLNNLFEPFFTTKEVGKGTGLGLATVYGIIKQNNGFINVYSEPGHGTTFKLYLPRTDLPVSEERHSEHGEKDLGGTETILLVEDEESVLALGKAILERYGYAVLTARSPAEAMSLAERHPGPIHLLVTDVVMPGMNGRELKERLYASRPGLKCVFVSGYTANMVAHRGILDEGVHFLQKPFPVKALAEKVREVLDS
jgi:signal transduction histidine kinase